MSSEGPPLGPEFEMVGNLVGDADGEVEGLELGAADGREFLAAARVTPVSNER